MVKLEKHHWMAVLESVCWFSGSLPVWSARRRACDEVWNRLIAANGCSTIFIEVANENTDHGFDDQERLQTIVEAVRGRRQQQRRAG